MTHRIGFGEASMIAIGMARAFAEQQKRWEIEEEARQMFKPQGMGCHVWPPHLRPFELMRWEQDTRQQRRARERAARKR